MLLQLETFEGFAISFVDNKGDKCMVILSKNNKVLNFF